jgi:hypothetical protein
MTTTQIGTVIPDDGLRVRSGPGTDHDILGALTKGEQVTLIEQVGEWWHADTRFGPGFVHADFIAVEPGFVAPAVVVTEEASYTCVSGDTLGGIGARFGIDFREIAVINGLVEPFTIQVGQVLRLPGGGPRPATTTLSILNPLEFAGETQVTSSSLQGHHTPYLGACSCDLDIRGASSPGTPVRFNVVTPSGVDVRGIVREVGLACRSQVLSDGGRVVKLAVQKRESGGDWFDSGAWVLFAHLDPVHVGVGDVVDAGGFIGALGPSGGGEYDSNCARGSHVHVEATRARCIINEGSVIRDAAVMTLDG